MAILVNLEYLPSMKEVSETRFFLKRVGSKPCFGKTKTLASHVTEGLFTSFTDKYIRHQAEKKDIVLVKSQHYEPI